MCETTWPYMFFKTGKLHFNNQHKMQVAYNTRKSYHQLILVRLRPADVLGSGESAAPVGDLPTVASKLLWHSLTKELCMCAGQ